MTADGRNLRSIRMPGFRFAGAAAIAIAASAFALLSGCNSKPSTVSPGSPTDTRTAAQRTEDRCATLIEAVGDIFDLERLGVSAQVDDGVNRLNDWQRSCGGTALDARISIPESIRNALTDKQVAGLNERRFTNRDGEHLRDAMLLKAVAAHAVGQAETDLERVLNLFDHVVRNIDLVPQHLFDLPLPPYYTYMLGKGTIADRAWILAGLLREIKIDTVILLPEGSSHELGRLTGPFLVGVLLDGKVYLFDPQAGIAIPAPAGDAPRKRTDVATLDQAIDDAQVLKQVDVDEEHRYPIESSQLKNLKVALITDTSYWSIRMKALSEQLSGDKSLVVYDPLEEGESAGLWHRVVAAGRGHWEPEAISPWSYTESQLARHADPSGDEISQLNLLIDSWNSFLMVLIGPDGTAKLAESVIVKDPSSSESDPNIRYDVHSTQGMQRRARLAQVGGNFADALKGYIEVRGGCMRLLSAPLAIDKVIIARHIRAEDDAAYWTGLCKVEQEEYEIAVTLLQGYREKHAQGAWVAHSRFLSAISLAALGKFKEAIELLEQTPADSPEYFGHQFRIRQWRAATMAEKE
jgi:hypothetical protein